MSAPTLPRVDTVARRSPDLPPPARSWKVAGRRAAKDRLATVLVWSAFAIVMLPLVTLMWAVVSNGLPMMSPQFFTWSMRNVVGEGGGIYHALMGTLLVTLFAAYAGSRTLAPGVEYKAVFRIVSTVAFAGYALGEWPISIWYRRGFALAAKSTFDALIYALLTAGVFGWLWPE